MFFKIVVAFGLAVSACPAVAQIAPAGVVDLYVFAGQSNMRGHVSPLTSEYYGPALIPAPYKAIFQAPVIWAQEWNDGHERPALGDAASGVFGTNFVPYFAAHDSATQAVWPWGPEVAFLANRHAVNAGTIYFVKYAIGGTSLYNKPDIANWSAQATGVDSLMAGLVGRVTAATAWLLHHGAHTVSVHLLWDQGESDMGVDGKSYLNNFLNFNTAIRSLLKAPQVLFNVASMTLVADPASHNAEADINIAATHVSSQVVNEHDFDKKLFIIDNIHLGPAGQILHGIDMELNTRTRPRIMIDRTRTAIIALNIPIPKSAGLIAYIPTIADGSTGLEIIGLANGLTLDPLTGRISATDPSLLVPGMITMTLRRHTATSIELSTLNINLF